MVRMVNSGTEATTSERYSHGACGFTGRDKIVSNSRLLPWPCRLPYLLVKKPVLARADAWSAELAGRAGEISRNIR